MPFCFHPDPMGGTEVYVAAVVKEMVTRGIEAIIAAPGQSSQEYEFDGIPISRFAVGQKLNNLRELYGEGDRLAGEEFDKILNQIKPNVVHLHAFTRGVSLRIVRAAKARAIPVVFTYHTPTTTCQRGTMMRWGAEPCAGLMRLHTCARCTLHGLLKSEVGWPGPLNARSVVRGPVIRALAYCIGSLPPALGSLVSVLGSQLPAQSSPVLTALRMTELVQLRHATARSLFAEVDHIVAVCDWVRQVLLRNGVPASKITLCRQGVAEGGERRAQDEDQGQKLRAKAQGPFELRLACLGRFDPTKGIHILVQALRSLPDARIRLDCYGIAQGKPGKVYEQQLRRLAESDGRIEFRAPVRPEAVVETLQKFDLLAVPSQWLETGPLVVLEAFAAGIPVIGSRLGGIAELVHDGQNGILVSAPTVAAWADALRDLCNEPQRLQKLRENILRPPTVTRVANEMLQIYERLLASTKDVTDRKLRSSTRVGQFYNNVIE